jgi:hypothetical protein
MRFTCAKEGCRECATRTSSRCDQEMLTLLGEVLSRVAEGIVEHAVVVVDRHGFRTAPLPVRPDLMTGLPD